MYSTQGYLHGSEQRSRYFPSLLSQRYKKDDQDQGSTPGASTQAYVISHEFHPLTDQDTSQLLY